MKLLLTAKGQEIQVDDEDYEWLEMLTWHVNVYAKTHFGLGKLGLKIHMHKLILAGCHYNEWYK